MAFLIAGINYKTASVALLEKVAFTSEKLTDGLINAEKMDSIDEIAILSTCNRTEIYCRGSITAEQLCNWISTFHRLDISLLRKHIYSYRCIDAIQHLMRVASGLDSLVLGEPQILGQVKTSISRARELNTAGTDLNGLFEAAATTARLIRKRTDIGKNPVSIAYAAVSLARQIFENLSRQTVLLIGSGETITLVARHLKSQNIGRMIVANRTTARADFFSREYNAVIISLDQLPEILPQCDLIFTATASSEPILQKYHFESVVKKRRHAPIFIVDLAVPRDIDPAVTSLADIYYYTIDDLREVVESNLNKRQEAAVLAEELILSAAQRFISRQEIAQATEFIRQYRSQAEAVRYNEVQKALMQLRAGADPAAIIDKVSRKLTNKLIHSPCAWLNRSDQHDLQDRLTWTRELFNLENQNEV